MGSIKATNNVVRFDYGKVKGKLSSFAFNTVWRNGLLNRYTFMKVCKKKLPFFHLLNYRPRTCIFKLRPANDMLWREITENTSCMHFLNGRFYQTTKKQWCKD